jgi:hypothetical protein
MYGCYEKDYFCESQGIQFCLIDNDLITNNDIGGVLYHSRFRGVNMFSIEAQKNKHISKFNLPWYKRDFISLFCQCYDHAPDGSMGDQFKECINQILQAKNIKETHDAFLFYVRSTEKKSPYNCRYVDVDKSINDNITPTLKFIKKIMAEDKAYSPSAVLWNDFAERLEKKRDNILDIIREFTQEKLRDFSRVGIYTTIWRMINENEEKILSTFCNDEDETGKADTYMRPFNYNEYLILCDD